MTQQYKFKNLNFAHITINRHGDMAIRIWLDVEKSYEHYVRISAYLDICI